MIALIEHSGISMKASIIGNVQLWYLGIAMGIFGTADLSRPMRGIIIVYDDCGERRHRKGEEGMKNPYCSRGRRREAPFPHY